MKSSLFNKRGETLIEVLLAIIILLVGVTSAIKLFNFINTQRQVTAERIIATNLAREGLEAVRNIRDTNWLRFAGEIRKCWNLKNPQNCNDVNKIQNNQSYRLNFDQHYRFFLEEISSRLNFQDNIADELYRLKFNSSQLYNHTTGENSAFFREIYTEYLTAAQEKVSGTATNILRVTSRVVWKDRGQTNDVILTTILTDHLNRRNHD